MTARMSRAWPTFYHRKSQCLAGCPRQVPGRGSGRVSSPGPRNDQGSDDAERVAALADAVVLCPAGPCDAGPGTSAGAGGGQWRVAEAFARTGGGRHGRSAGGRVRRLLGGGRILASRCPAGRGAGGGTGGRCPPGRAGRDLPGRPAAAPRSALAHLLAQSGRHRLPDPLRLAGTGRHRLFRHRLAGAGAARHRPAGQLWL